MRKGEIASRLPIRRGLDAAEAAVYVGVGSTLFLRMIAAGTMPKARLVPGSTRKVWDVRELDAAFDDFPHEGQDKPNTWADFRGNIDA